MKFGLAIVAAAVVAHVTFANPVVWSGAGAGDWTDDDNWEGSAPSAGDTAVIPSGATAPLMTAEDFTLANSLAAINLAAADSTLLIGNTASKDLTVPVTGSGLFAVDNGQTVLNLKADNTGFTGPFFFTNSLVVVRNIKALGTSNVVTNYSEAPKSGSSTPTRLEIEVSGEFGNEFHLFGPSSGSSRMVYYCENDYVTNSGPCYVYGNSVIQGPSGFHGFGFVTFSGGFHHTGAGYARIAKKVRIVGDTPCSIRTTENYLRGGILVQPDAELEFGAAVKKESSLFGSNPFARIAVRKGILRFVGTSSFPDNNQGALAFGNSSENDNDVGTIDLNGYSQTICDHVKEPKTLTSRTILTSATPATLTIRGTFYRYGFYNWKNAESKVANVRLEGQVSYELNSVQSSLDGRWQAGDGHTYFTNETSTTRGYLSVVRGTMRLGADTSWPNLSELRTGKNGILLVDTAAVNPGRFLFSVTNSATASVTIADGILLDAKKAVIDGTYLDPGIYGSSEAGLDAEHTLSFLSGTGRLKVRLPEHPGMMLWFR